MLRILAVVLFAIAALGTAACVQTGAAPADASSAASPAALTYDLPDNTDLSEAE